MMNTDDADRQRRAHADLRGAAGVAARNRRVRRQAQRATRRLARALARFAALERTVDQILDARAHQRAVAALSDGCPALVMQPRTVNALIVTMAVSDAAFTAAAIEHAFREISPAAAAILSLGIGLSLVSLGKLTGARLATYRRIDDEGVRSRVLTALAAMIVAIAAVGLTVLREQPAWSWPLLVLAVPAGSVALTWFTHNPPRAQLARAELQRQRIEQIARRRDRHVVDQLARHDRHRTNAEQRFRARLAAAMRRAITDGAIDPDDIEQQSRIVRLLVADHLPSTQAADELRRRRDALWARLDTTTVPPPPRPELPAPAP